MQKAKRRGKPYITAVQRGLDWKEYMKTHPIPVEGETIKIRDPDTNKVYSAVVIRIAGNGLRAIFGNEELIAVDRIDDGVWN